MKKTALLTLLILTFNLIFCVSLLYAEPFVPVSDVMGVNAIKPGMKGYAVTVIEGTETARFPVEVISTVPQKSKPGKLILIRAGGPVIEKTGGIASGMSGSPVYIAGKLVGAIGYGWNFSEHDLGLVTPIEEMASIWEWPEDPPAFPFPVNITPVSKDQKDNGKNIKSQDLGTNILFEGASADIRSLPVYASGISSRAAENIGKVLDEKVVNSIIPVNDDIPVEYNARLEPGEAVGVLMAWGDVSMGATGTLTAVSREGRFVAFAHPFLNRGNVAFPLTRSWIHSVIPSVKSPFKLGTPLAIVGSVTQDRAQGIGGRIGKFLPAIDVSLKLEDTEFSRSSRKRFHIASDPFLVSKIFPELLVGVIDDLWGRKGEGTFRVDLEIEGGTLSEGWNTSNYFFSDKDIATVAAEDLKSIVDAVSLNPFRKINPLGFYINIQATSEPKVLYIEKLKVDKKKIKAGEELKIEVTMRPYRKKQITKEFTLSVPEKAFGPCEVLVRGGGISPMEQESIYQGLNTISSFKELLEELNAREANNEVIIELVYNEKPDNNQNIDNNEDELLSAVKERRMKEGTLRIFKSNYYVEGLLRKKVTVVPVSGDGSS